jgi:hypothetical protein
VRLLLAARVTHGPPVLTNATAALAKALEAGPWNPDKARVITLRYREHNERRRHPGSYWSLFSPGVAASAYPWRP